MTAPIVSVLVDDGPLKALDYAIPLSITESLRPGSLVTVPLRGRPASGIVCDFKETSSYQNLLSVISVAKDEDGIPSDLFELSRWVADYYMAPLASVLRSVRPPSIRDQEPKRQLSVRAGLTKEALRLSCIELREKAPKQAAVLEAVAASSKPLLLSELLEESKAQRSSIKSLADKGLLLLEEVVVDRSPLRYCDYFPTLPKQLNSEQKIAFDSVQAADQFATFLLHGVTGSGKTEVYLQLIEEKLKRGQGTIVLVPEIALTTQLVERFCSRFQNKIAVLHHRLADGERADEWRRIRQGSAPVVIGARSAVFSPVPHLGLLIVDEEHEPSYKQSDARPCYHARDVAIMRAKLTGSAVVLGSATPSLESFHNARSGKYRLLELKQRADVAKIPQVRIIDMKAAREKAGGFTLFCSDLIDELKNRYAVGEQAILFLNRRGWAPMQWCAECQLPVRCKHCDLSLTFHKGQDHLACHLCGYTLSPPPRTCPSCGANSVKFCGAGTEQVERALRAVLPELRTIRIDADTTRHKGSIAHLLRDFRTGRADVLIGTQMIAKGLHFPQVTLVGVLNSDASLLIPDFRASEHLFQLLTQVAGRAGRGETPGLVLIQTMVPDNPLIRLAASQDYERFFAREIEGRRRFGFPPYSHLLKLLFIGQDAESTRGAASEMHLRIAGHLKAPHAAHPVTEAGHARIKDLYRFQCLLKGPSVRHMNDAVRAALACSALPSEVRLSIDVDPISTYF